MEEFARRRVLVTGAGRGVGAAVAKAFGRAGATVVLASRKPDSLERVKAEIEAGGGRAEVQPVDLATRAACRDLARRAGDIDILINNAAWTDMSYASVLDIPDEEWDIHWAVSFVAPLVLMQELGRGMAKRKSGVILNISSTAAQLGVPYLATYNVVKAALDALSRCAGMELAADRTGIRVNSIVLGHVDTETLQENCGPGLTTTDVAERNMPLGRPITPDEVAALCVYLASDAAAPILGAVINIDGGMTSGMYSFMKSFGPKAAGS